MRAKAKRFAWWRGLPKRLYISVWQTDSWEKPILHLRTRMRPKAFPQPSTNNRLYEKQNKTRARKPATAVGALQSGRLRLHLLTAGPWRGHQREHSELRLFSGQCNHPGKRLGDLEVGWLPP